MSPEILRKLYPLRFIRNLRLVPRNGVVMEGSGNSNYSSESLMSDEFRIDTLIQPLFNSVPAFNEAASYLYQTTSLFTRCFTDYSVEYPSRDSGGSATDDHELVSFSSGERVESMDGDYTSARKFSPVSEPSSSAIASTLIHDDAMTVSSDDVSQTAGPLIQTNLMGLNGIPLFQGLIERVRRTVRGSADDIGWLQREPGMPPVEDGTERFMEILDNIKHGLHKLPNSIVYLLVPGLFSNHGPLYFVNTKACFSKMGLTCHIAKIHSEASVEKNAREIKEYIEEMYWGSNKRAMLLGHSKGGVDSAAALSLYWSDLKDKVAGLALAQSPYGGSPIASDILREGQLGDYVNVRKLMEIIICKVIKGDMQALEDLTYERRRQFLTSHPLPEEIPIVSLNTEAGISPAVLATLSHVAEFPSPLSTNESTKLPVVMPLGAAMAACAQLLHIRYGEKSDGLVTRRDAEVPGYVVVHPKRKMDHAWMVYSSLNDDTKEGNSSQVCEALLTLLVEVGQRKMHEIAMQDE